MALEVTSTVFCSQDELRDLLLAANVSCSFCSVEYSTKPDGIRNPKTSGMGERITKTARVNPLIGNSMEYINAINRRLIKNGREQISEVKPRTWGRRVKDTPFVIHTNKQGETHVYLECQFIGKPKTQWFLDKKAVAYDAVKPYLRPKKEADTYDLGEDAPQWRNIRLDHINEVQVNHTRYVVV